MTIYLVQHGQAQTKNGDSDPGLCLQGIEDVTRVAQVAFSYHIKVRKIIHSTKKRAIETATILQEILLPWEDMELREEICPKDNPSILYDAIIGDIKEWNKVLIVGHQPYLNKLLSLLIVQNPDEHIFEFQRGGIVCLRPHQESRAFSIHWSLMPYIV